MCGTGFSSFYIMLKNRNLTYCIHYESHYIVTILTYCVFRVIIRGVNDAVKI